MSKAANPIISVIMPLYNKRNYVRRAVDSVLNQSSIDWELIIIDDGSTDGSVEAVPSDDSRIRLFHQDNRGPAAARNKGISLATGEFITFLDADDYYYPEKLQTEVSLLQKNEADWMVSPFEYKKSNQAKIRFTRDSKCNELKTKPLVLNNAFVELELQGLHIDGLCVRKNILEQLGGFNERMLCYEIIELIIRCALFQPRVVIYHEPLFCVVDVPQSAFKILPHQIDGKRQIGESLLRLSKAFPEHSSSLEERSENNLITYAASLIREYRSTEARQYLNNDFPYKRTSRWWKVWIGTWMPAWFLRHKYVNSGIFELFSATE